MAFFSQSMNTFNQSPILGQVDLLSSPDIVSVQILPTSSATSIQVGDPVKLVAGTSGAILVDKQTGPTDATVFGIIPYNERKNIYLAGDFCEVCRGSTYIYLLSGGAVARGDTVSTTSSTTSADPTVSTDTTTGHFITGIAVDPAAGAGTLIRINISPSTHA